MKARCSVVLAMVVGCGGSGDAPMPDAAPDTQPPQLVSSTPADGEMKTSVLASFTFVFDEALDPATVDDSTVRVLRRDDDSFPRVAGTISYDDTAHSVTFTPLAPLTWDSLYLVTLGAIKDTSGNAFAGAAPTFHTYTNGVAREIIYSNTGQVQSWDGYELDANGHTLKDITYSSPGSNQVWLDGDDVASQRYDFTYAADGRLLTYRQLTNGNDGVANTGDDVITLQDSYTYDAMLRRTRYAEVNGAGTDATWGTADDLQIEHGEYAWGDGLAITSHAYFNNAGTDGIWNNADDTGTFWRLVEHDAQNNITRITYTLDGADGLPMTGDDAIQNSTTYQFDATTFTQTRSVAHAADDTIQSYVQNTNDATGQLVLRVPYASSGTDTMWFTADDVASGRQDRSYDANHLVVQRDNYSGPGNDGVWHTADDVMTTRREYDTAH